MERDCWRRKSEKSWNWRNLQEDDQWERIKRERESGEDVREGRKTGVRVTEDSGGGGIRKKEAVGW